MFIFKFVIAACMYSENNGVYISYSCWSKKVAPYKESISYSC